MSMPSSRLLVATRAGSRPAFSSSSIRVRCSRARLPWWARATSSSASSFSRRARRSASRRLLTKMSVERWARISSSSSGYIAGQMERRRPSPPGTSMGSSSSPGGRPSSRMSSTGTTTLRSSSFEAPASTIDTGRGRPSPSWPPRKRAISASGRCVADRPIRWRLPPAPDTRRSRRSRLSARCVPRLVPATAWISLTITARMSVRISVPREVRSRYRLSGVVMRMSGGVRSIRWRSRWGVSPVRTATDTSGASRPCSAAAAAMPASGPRRLRSTS